MILQSFGQIGVLNKAEGGMYMKKHTMVKRILSAFLAIVLVVGIITVSEPNDAKASTG